MNIFFYEIYENHSYGIFFLILGLLATFAAIVAITGVYLLLNGEEESASNYAAFAGGFATVILVLLTAWQTQQTRWLVDEERQLEKEETVKNWYRNLSRPAIQLNNQMYEMFSNFNYLDDNGNLDLDRNSSFEIIKAGVDQLKNEAYPFPANSDKRVQDHLQSLLRDWGEIEQTTQPGQGRFIVSDEDFHFHLRKLVNILQTVSK